MDPVSLTLGIAGLATSLFGANKQAKAQAAANAANLQAVRETNAANTANAEKANQLAWAQWLMARGVNPGSNVTPGVIPTGTGAVNTRMPAWATVRRAVTPGARPVARPTTADRYGRSWAGLGL